MLVNYPSLLGAHRIHLNRASPVQSLLRRSVGPRSKGLASALAVSSRIDHNPFPLPQPPESGLVSQKLKRIDRLAPLPDQQPVILVPVDGGRNPIVVLDDLDLPLQIELVQNPLDKLPNPLRRLLRPISFFTHTCTLFQQRTKGEGRASLPAACTFWAPTWRRQQTPSPSKKLSRKGCPTLPTYRRFFFFRGEGGGGFAALTSAGVGTAGAGIKRWIVYCWPIVQKLVVIQ